MKETKNIPAIKLPSFSIDDKAVKAVLKSQKFPADENLVNAAREFIRRVDYTTQVFNYNHHEVNLPIIKAFNKNVRDLAKYSDGDLRNITAIDVYVKKGKQSHAIRFYNDGLSGHLIKKLLGEPKPDMTVNGSLKAQAAYMTSNKLVMPLREYKTVDIDQLFISVVKDAIPLGTFLYGTYTKKKVQIQTLVMALLKKFFADLETPAPDAEDKAFKNHFNKALIG